MKRLAVVLLCVAGIAPVFKLGIQNGVDETRTRDLLRDRQAF